VVARERACEVYAPPRRGSGTLVRDRLVLTAAHVVGEVGTDAWVRFLGTSDKLRCLVAERVETADTALLQIVDKGTRLIPPPSGVPPVPWGMLVSSEPGIRCEALGFPEVRVTPDNVHDVEHLSGTINPVGGDKINRLAVDVDSPPAPTPPSRRSQWAGASGAGVFIGQFLVGVVTEDARGFDSRRLTMVPVTEFVGAMAQTMWPEFQDVRSILEPVELAGLQSFLPDAQSPAALLRADVAAVPFHRHGRDESLDRLQRWCAGLEQLSVALVTGRGGQGKTRLARQLAHDLRGAGWTAVYLARYPEPEAFRFLSSAAVKLLVVVDYAEQRHEQMIGLDRALTRRDPFLPPVRVLMLARQDGEWRARSDGELALVKVTEVVPLSALHPEATERTEAFSEAVRAYADRLGGLTGYQDIDWQAAASQVATPDLTDQPTALAIQAHALAGLLRAGQPVDEPGNPAGATAANDILDDHEARYWAGEATRRGLDLAATTQRFAIAVATVLPVADLDGALRVLACVPGLRDSDENRRMAVAEWLAGLYPQRGAQWGEMLPHLLAERLVGTVLATSPRLLDEVLQIASESQAHHALTVLARASAHQPQLRPITTRLVAEGSETLRAAAATVATETPHHRPLTAGIDEYIARHREHPDRLTALYEAFPVGGQVHAARAAEVCQLIVGGCRRQMPTRPWIRRFLRRRLSPEEMPAYARLARAVTAMSSRLAVVGRWADALAAAEEAVLLYRRLARADSDTHQTDLAKSLGVLSSRCAAVGQHGAALAAAEEAVDLYRRLVRLDPDGYEADLARTSASVANRRAALGDHEGALTASEAAVRTYRKLVARYPGRHGADLARSLDELSNRYATVSHRHSALVATDSAVEVYRRLADRNPHIFEPDLARLLGVLSDRRADLGHLEDALAAATEAVELYRRLATSQPPMYEPALAGSLEILSRRMADLYLLKEALATISEAVELYRRLTADHPGAFEPALARSLEVLSDRLAALNKLTPALAAVTEAVERYDRLAAAEPDAYAHALERSLGTLSNRLEALSPVGDALATVRSSIDVCRRLTERDRATFQPHLARSLGKHSMDLAYLNRRDEALATAQEALALYRDLADADPDSHEADLAMCLETLAHRFAALDRREEALAATKEAVDTYHRLAKRQPETFETQHAKTLVGLSADLVALGRRDQALDTTERAVNVYRNLVEVQPDPSMVEELARTLEYLAADYSALRRDREARKASDEARLLYQRLARSDPARYAHLAESPENETAVQRASEQTPTYESRSRIDQQIRDREPG
jgi:tetratricopeptide (TPR) repeat protein